MGNAKRKKASPSAHIPLGLVSPLNPSLPQDFELDKTTLTDRDRQKIFTDRKELMDRATPEAIELSPFDRTEWDCPPDMVIVRRFADRVIAKGDIKLGKAERQQAGTVEVSGFEWCKPGDEVLFTKFGGTDIQLDDAELVHVHKLQIYARRRAKAAPAVEAAA